MRGPERFGVQCACAGLVALLRDGALDLYGTGMIVSGMPQATALNAELRHERMLRRSNGASDDVVSSLRQSSSVFFVSTVARQRENGSP